uniref:C2H2-type domain-containing protein n=1 Tax=Nothoprocta perdicaria TaxID=30464 RepID=A0A8C6Z6R5_NOTPE
GRGAGDEAKLSPKQHVPRSKRAAGMFWSRVTSVVLTQTGALCNRTVARCEKSFYEARDLRQHMNKHLGPFECLTCGVAWADARSLKRHVRTHTGERPYVCPVCNEAYIDARTLRKHMTKFHRDYVPCKIMLEKDTLQFHNQGTQVEHAVSILAADVQEPEAELGAGGEQVETVVVTGETLDAIEAVAATEECASVSTLSDHGIMQVVNYVLAQQQGQKLAEVTQALETVEVEVAQVSETDMESWGEKRSLCFYYKLC